MEGVIEIPVWLAAALGLAAAVGITDRVIAPSFRWFLRRRLLAAADRLNERLQLRIQPFKLMRRKELVDRLTYDPEVAEAAEAHCARTGMPRDIAMGQVARYAREITPSFSAHMYFAVGARVSRWICRALYDVRVETSGRAALEAIDKRCAVVFVANHRSNVDYLLVTYLASDASALSYAVGEWAQVWPLNRLIRLMGAYFIRRRDRDDLYRAVLRRYVRMATEGGVAQAIFPEGGLSRDGRMGPAKLGLISYIVEGFDPVAHRDVVFVPVGLNYDRVLEDRVLMGAGTGRDGKARFNINPIIAAGFVLRVVWGRATGLMQRFGTACVNFGPPLSLTDHLRRAAPGADVVAALGAELTARIGRATPVAPTALAAAALRDGPATLDRAEAVARAVALAERLAAAGAQLVLPEGGGAAAAAEAGLNMLTLRRIVEAQGAQIAVRDAPALAFYANAIAHLPGAPPPPS